MNWELDDDESTFCECGVTGPLDDAGLCPTCAAAPHGRECPCDECEAYWHRIAEESERAAAAYNAARSSPSGSSPEPKSPAPLREGDR